MKKIFKCISVSILSLCLISAFVSQYSADSTTVYITDGYSYTVNDYGLLSLCGWDNSTTDFVVPNKLNGKYVGEIESFGFRNNSIITSLDFSAPTKFDTIGTYAFDGCVSISGELVLPRKIGFIGDAAFKDCSSIQSLRYVANTDTISRMCFSGCTSLESVVITAGAKEIEPYAFENCTSLREITIPKTINTIDSTAFCGCNNISIQCYDNSYAMQYAVDNGIDYDVIDPLLGDVDGNGKINIRDVTYIQLYGIGRYNLDKHAFKRANVNLDDKVNIRDATYIQLYLVGRITSFDNLE